MISNYAYGKNADASEIITQYLWSFCRSWKIIFHFVFIFSNIF